MKDTEQKKILHHMILALEHDLMEFLAGFVLVEDLTDRMIELVQKRAPKASGIMQHLEQLGGISDLFEIINICKGKSGLTENEIEFFNKHCKDMPAIRNRVMHSRPLEFTDEAVVANIFKKIDGYVHNIVWSNTKKARADLKDNLEKILTNSPIEQNKKVLTNLPELDCEEIEFIGRGKEIGEVKKYLANPKIGVISIVAGGGFGKTALTLKVLNDLIKEKRLDYELVVWVTFKTKQLDATSFVEIKDSITDIASAHSLLYDFIGTDGKNVQSELIKLAQEFKALLVLDNLETMATNEIIPFLEEFINYGKVVITTRTSLGELEKRYDLPPLNDKDVIDYTNQLLEHYNLDDMFSIAQVSELAKETLFSNPLSIKWAIRSMANGLSLNDIKKRVPDVVNFCMSNVYGKISALGKRVLHLLLFINKPVTKGVIVYYLKNSKDNEIDKATNELTRACFIDKNRFFKEDLYSLTEQAKIFISSLKISLNWREDFANRQRELANIRQQVDVESENDPYHSTAISIFTPTEDNIIAAYFLYRAVELINKKDNNTALELISQAQAIAPKYSECYKIHGLVLSYQNELSAKDMYDKAIAVSITNKEALVQYVAAANHHIVNRNPQLAFDYLKRAELQDDNNVYVKLELAKVLTYLGKFDDSEAVLNSIENSFKNQKEQNIFSTRKADLWRRKADLLTDKSQSKQRIELLMCALKLLQSEKYPDNHLNTMICRVIGDLACSREFNSVAKKVLAVLRNRMADFEKKKEFYGMYVAIQRALERLDKKLVEEFTDVLFGGIAHLPTQENLGLVTKVGTNDKGFYGFANNLNHPEGLYFVNSVNARRGDLIEFKIAKFRNGNMCAIPLKLYSKQEEFPTIEE